MANGHGGARIGAGQKKKALSDKIVEGNPGKRRLTVMEFSDNADLQGCRRPVIFWRRTKRAAGSFWPWRFTSVLGRGSMSGPATT